MAGVGMEFWVEECPVAIAEKAGHEETQQPTLPCHGGCGVTYGTAFRVFLNTFMELKTRQGLEMQLC